jgi:hypothetical protein
MRKGAPYLISSVQNTRGVQVEVACSRSVVVANAAISLFQLLSDSSRTKGTLTTSLVSRLSYGRHAFWRPRTPQQGCVHPAMIAFRCCVASTEACSIDLHPGYSGIASAIQHFSAYGQRQTLSIVSPSVESLQAADDATTRNRSSTSRT